jgi:hypothetical protein
VGTYSKIFQDFELLPRLPNSLKEELKSKHIDQNTDHCHGNEPNDDRTNHQDASGKDSKHDACQATVAATSDEENAVAVD